MDEEMVTVPIEQQSKVQDGQLQSQIPYPVGMQDNQYHALLVP
jgi:hypothetical protein